MSFITLLVMSEKVVRINNDTFLTDYAVFFIQC